jgi:hypothetical protein
MVTYDPPKKGNTKPATMADINPVIGGAPDATAIPMEKGVETRATNKPANKSDFQYLRPAKPFWGFPMDLDCVGTMVGEPDVITKVLILKSYIIKQWPK